MKQLMIKTGNFLFKYRNKVFPLIIVALFAVQLPVHTIFGSIFLCQVKDFLAVALTLTGLAIRSLVIGYAYIKRGGLNKKVYANNLVTEGLFGICRNPLYVGNVLIYSGVFLLHGAPVVAISGIALFLFIYQSIIYAEEAYLANKFGSAYVEYCNDTPRWLPLIRDYSSAVEGMKFDFGKAIKKDYSTMTTALVSLAATQIYKYMSAPVVSDYSQNIVILVILVVISGLFAATVRYFKKRKPKLCY